jgi:hypothetical protein
MTDRIRDIRPEVAWTTTTGIVALSYACISGFATQPRRWDLFARLHAPEARLIRLLGSGSEPIQAEVLSPQDYARTREPLLARLDFFETEVEHRVERHRRLAQVFSRYEARTSPDGPVLFAGFNSLQLTWSADRWWILTTVWDGSEGQAALASLGYTLTQV